VIYQDTAAPSGGFTSADFQAMGALFDQELYGLASNAFGSESDLDANGRVAILMTSMVNRLASPLSCLGASVIGYFMGHDIDPSSADDPRSNQGEVFYSIVPDPNGEAGCTHPLDRTRELVPVTFIHEFQHMINFYQHVVVRAGDAEDMWLNEGMSQIAEDLAALHFRDLGNAQLAEQFSIKNFTNGNRFLRQPQDHFVLFDTGAGTGAERGAAWLFLRWLGDRYGQDVYRLLAESDEVGATNVENATGRSIGGLLGEWFAALYVSHLDGFETPSNLRYLSWSLRDRYEALHGEDPVQFARAFPLQPMEHGSDPFLLSIRVRAGSGQHVLVSHSAGADPFRLGVEATEGNPSVRLGVMRLR
jgi:hypothetical protein